LTTNEHAELIQLHMETLMKVPLGGPEFLEHLEACALPIKECAICLKGDQEFMMEYLREMYRDRRLTFREKLFGRYLNIRLMIRDRIWRWRGGKGPRPTWTLERQ